MAKETLSYQTICILVYLSVDELKIALESRAFLARFQWLRLAAHADRVFFLDLFVCKVLTNMFLI